MDSLHNILQVMSMILPASLANLVGVLYQAADIFQYDEDDVEQKLIYIYLTL